MNDWQRRQAAECSCKGSDDMCPCQNVDRRAPRILPPRAEHPLLNRRLDEFEWSVRSLNAMMNVGMVHVRDLCGTTEYLLGLTPNFGAKSMLEVKEWLVGRGLRLGMDIGRARVEPIRTTAAYSPCVARVKVSSIATRTREFRAEKTLRRGLPIEQCADRSTWLVDGLPLCLAHGGRRALAILAGEEALPPIVGRRHP